MSRRRPKQFVDTLDQARSLRREPTAAEKLLWRKLRRRALVGLKFRRQHPVGDYVVDFYCADCRLGIEDVEHPFTLFDLADRLRVTGWQVPAYTLPANRQDLAVQRILVRHDFSRDMASLLLEDYRRALAHLDRHPRSVPLDGSEASGFRH